MSKGAKAYLGFILVVTLIALLCSSSRANQVQPIEITLPITIGAHNSLDRDIYLLTVANPGQNIKINIVGFGGNAIAMFKFITAMEQTKGTIHCSVTGPSFSAHALIALACNKYANTLVISPYSFLMIHSVQGQKGGRVRTNFNELTRPLLIQALSNEEITELFSDDNNSEYLTYEYLRKKLSKVH